MVFAPPQFLSVRNKQNAHAGGAWTCAWDNAADRLVTGGLDDTVKIWDKNAGEPTHVIHEPLSAIVRVATTADGQYAASTSLDHIMRVYDLTNPSGIVTRKHELPPLSAWACAFVPTVTSADAISDVPSSPLIVHSSNKGQVQLRDALHPEAPARDTYDGTGNFGMCVAASPNGQMVCCGDDRGNIRVWDVATTRILNTFQEHTKAVRSVAFSHDSKWLYTASDDRRVNIYDPFHGDRVATIAAHSSWALAVAPSPDDDMLLTSSADHKLKLWDLRQQNQCLDTIDVHQGPAWSVAWRADGHEFCSVSEDASVQWFARMSGGKSS